MKTVLTYDCECGESIYEDDSACINCEAPVDKSRLKEEEIADIKHATYANS
jgi:hypothetical protein